VTFAMLPDGYEAFADILGDGIEQSKAVGPATPAPTSQPTSQPGRAAATDRGATLPPSRPPVGPISKRAQLHNLLGDITDLNANPEA
jgi:hypothetical protein